MNADPNPAKAIFLEAVERHAPDQWPAFLDRASPAGRTCGAGWKCSWRPTGRSALLHTANRPRARDPPVATVDEPPVREQPGTVDRPVQAARGDRRRRHGHRLDGRADAAGQAAGRGQAHQGRHGLAAGAGPVRGRAAGAGADGPPEHRQGARRRRDATSGRPFFVMELVKGVPITEYCDERKLRRRERLELFVPVCQAVQHAHQKGDHPPRHQAVQRAGRARTTASRCRR